MYIFFVMYCRTEKYWFPQQNTDFWVWEYWKAQIQLRSSAIHTASVNQHTQTKKSYVRIWVTSNFYSVSCKLWEILLVQSCLNTFMKVCKMSLYLGQIFCVGTLMNSYSTVRAPVFDRHQSSAPQSIKEKPMEVYYLDEWIIITVDSRYNKLLGPSEITLLYRNFVISWLQKQYNTKKFGTLGPRKLLCYIGILLYQCSL